MGTQFWAICRTCNVRRDLDKFHSLMRPVMDRKDALEYREEVAGNAFRFGLLGSFMWTHQGHNCTVVDDYGLDAMLDAYDREEDLFRDDTDFWTPTEEKTSD